MKARTTNEKAVERLAGRIKPLTDAQRRWIARNAVPSTEYLRGKEEGAAAWCSNCGGEFSDFKHRRCPHCGAKFDKREYNARKRVSRGRYYTTLHTTCGGWQVSRHILVAHEARRGGSKARHEAHEVCQVWTNEQGKQVIWARPCCGLNHFYDQWIVDAPMSIKRKGTYCYRYDIDSFRYKICRVLPVLRRNGFKGDFHDIMPDDLWRLLLTDNFAETLFKCGQYPLVKLMANNGKLNRDAAMICVRHGYIVKDAYVWRDYIDMAERCGLDIHNPHYACPADLERAHDRIQQKHMLMSSADKIKLAEPRYKQAKGKYLGIEIKGKDIVIWPLQSVREFFNEGLSMHHCVFKNGYYDKPDSLILTARNYVGGERIETIEFDLREGRVVQSRGRFNKLTERHEDILSLMRDNTSRIMKVAQLRCS